MKHTSRLTALSVLTFMSGMVALQQAVLWTTDPVPMFTAQAPKPQGGGQIQQNPIRPQPQPPPQQTPQPQIPTQYLQLLQQMSLLVTYQQQQLLQYQQLQQLRSLCDLLAGVSNGGNAGSLQAWAVAFLQAALSNPNSQAAQTARVCQTLGYRFFVNQPTSRPPGGTIITQPTQPTGPGIVSEPTPQPTGTITTTDQNGNTYIYYTYNYNTTNNYGNTGTGGPARSAGSSRSRSAGSAASVKTGKNLTRMTRGLRLIEPIRNDGQAAGPVYLSNLPKLGIFYFYFNMVWPWVLGIAAGIAVLQALIGGIQIMMSGGGSAPLREEGQSRLTWAIAGLLLISFAGFILRFLNPLFYQ